MQEQIVSWSEFKDFVNGLILNNELSKCIFRGLSDSRYRLETSLDRSGLKNFEMYFQILPLLYGELNNQGYKCPGFIDNKEDFKQNVPFFTYLQHHGFPTPLLDWTKSPYIASFFAFEEVSNDRPIAEHVSIYCLHKEKWEEIKNVEPEGAKLPNYVDKIIDIFDDVSFAMGNNRLLLQQGCFTYSEITDIESLIQEKEGLSTKIALQKFKIKSEQKPVVMKDLDAMNINYKSLFGVSADSICRTYRQNLLYPRKVGVSVEEEQNLAEEEERSAYEEAMAMDAQAEEMADRFRD